MRATAEVRWFYPGAPPAAALAWFEALGPELDVEPPRTDRYVRPTDAGLNVKVRHGSLEVKRREHEAGVVELGAAVTGRLEQWQKWRIPAHPHVEALQPPGWIAVEKQRWTRAYRAEEEAVTPVKGGQQNGALCDVELTVLDLRGQPWWTVCFEAAGEEAERTDLLLRTARHVFGLRPPPTFVLERSFGYAAFLLGQ